MVSVGCCFLGPEDSKAGALRMTSTTYLYYLFVLLFLFFFCWGGAPYYIFRRIDPKIPF